MEGTVDHQPYHNGISIPWTKRCHYEVEGQDNSNLVHFLDSCVPDWIEDKKLEI